MATHTAPVADSQVKVTIFHSQEEVGTLLESVQDAIQRRAYQLFEERDPHDGSDLEDWFRAEDEVLFAAGPLVTLLDDRIDVRVDLGECQLTDLTLGIEPFRLVVIRRTKTEVENENNAFFRLVTLPGRSIRLIHLLQSLTLVFVSHCRGCKTPINSSCCEPLTSASCSSRSVGVTTGRYSASHRVARRR